MSHRPQVGEQAPDFTLPDAVGKPVRLGDLLATKVVVLYFYPKDETVGCIAESCAFRDAYRDFAAAGAEVVGVSRDDAASHTQFAKAHELPFLLLSDTTGKVHEQYGVRRALGGLLRDRVSFVIDQKGVVRMVFASRLEWTRHVSEALAAVKSARVAS